MKLELIGWQVVKTCGIYTLNIRMYLKARHLEPFIVPRQACVGAIPREVMCGFDEACISSRNEHQAE